MINEQRKLIPFADKMKIRGKINIKYLAEERNHPALGFMRKKLNMGNII